MLAKLRAAYTSTKFQIGVEFWGMITEFLRAISKREFKILFESLTKNKSPLTFDVGDDTQLITSQRKNLLLYELLNICKEKYSDTITLSL